MPDVPYNKPIPEPEQYITKPFWDGCKEGKLMLPRCTVCNKVHFYPRAICPFCQSTDLEWVEASGEGYIHTFAVQHRAFGGWSEEAPFITAYIDLKEGDRMFTVVRGLDANAPDLSWIGRKVKVEFDQASDEVSIPFWRVV